MRLRVPLAAAAALIAVGAAGAKEGVRATLTTPVDVHAAPGSTIHVAGTLADRDGHPFGAGSLFVRLLGRSGGSTFEFARSRSGAFSAEVTVPRDGLGGIRVGLRGSACGPSGCRVSDLYFPVVNDPFRSPAGVRCDVAAVVRALRTFAAAFSAGDLRRLDALFAQEPRFAWFSSGGPGVRFGAEAEKRRSLLPYLAARHRKHDRIRLLSYRFNGYEAQREIGHFGVKMMRQADDYRRGNAFEIEGKGAIDCSQSPVRFMVLSLGGP